MSRRQSKYTCYYFLTLKNVIDALLFTEVILLSSQLNCITVTLKCLNNKIWKVVNIFREDSSIEYKHKYKFLKKLNLLP